NIRAEVNTPLSKPITLLIQTSDQVIEDFLSENRNYLERFCNPETLVISSGIKAPELAMSQILTEVNIYLPLAGLIDVKAEVARLEKELTKWDQEVKRVTGKLSNERFVANAPAAIVQKERDKQADYLEKQKAVKDRILQLKNI
ncbi:MAG TPA: valine--tRNA ligase, partial [Tetragenococcus sp.]|nr:valine--tRNA ligase [Tetragenococcus sp.]